METLIKKMIFIALLMRLRVNMKKYLGTENATLELKFFNISKYSQFFKKNIDFIISQNFQRIILYISDSEIEMLISEIKDFFNDTNILIIIYSYFKEYKEFSLPDNVILVNENEEVYVVANKIFNSIKLNKKSVDAIIRYVKDNNNIIIDVTPNINHISEFNELITTLMTHLDGIAINFSGLIIPSFLIREHPCNAYLCDGWKCGLQISCLPKHILIDDDFNVYPHDLVYSKLKIGNVTSNKLQNVLESYLVSEEYKNFQIYNKNVFIKKLANYPFDYMPLLEYIRSEAENDK